MCVSYRTGRAARYTFWIAIPTSGRDSSDLVRYRRQQPAANALQQSFQLNCCVRQGIYVNFLAAFHQLAAGHELFG